MASAISYELYQSKLGAPNGVATLDPAGLIPVGQLPPSAVETYKGQYATSALLPLTGVLADYAYVTATSTYWYWNAALLPAAAWVDQQITEAAYNLLTAPEQAGVPYIVV